MQIKKFLLVVALAVAAIFFSASAQAQFTETAIYTFAGGTDGMGPWAGLIFDSAGNLYGTTYDGGDTTCYYQGCGTVFKLTPTSGGSWTETVLYAFGGGSDGANPYGSLTSDAAGNLYGTTFYGGDTTACAPSAGCGTVFELTPTSGGGWTESIVYAFKGGKDGKMPTGGLIFDPAGNLYGMTEEGGGTACGGYGCGTVFELTPSSSGWKETVLHSFTGGKDGGVPVAGLIFDAAGSLYGTTFNGGSNAVCYYGCGVAFKLTPSSVGWREGVLHTFTLGNDGGNPFGSLIFDGAGNLYGTTFSGGGVFKLTHGSGGGWIEGTIHSFGNKLEGAVPMAGVVFDSAGNLYGSTSTGNGQSQFGTVFELTLTSKGWRQSVRHTFTGGGDGGGPQSGLIVDAAGNLYGTAGIGGTVGGGCQFGCGVVYELSPVSAKTK
jgi:uncharacterized repeat protein (TIGR03803 family)